MATLGQRLVGMMAALLHPVLRPFGSIRIIGQIISVLGRSRTESYRQWDRQDEDRRQLIVLVHGFNSGKGAAWGEFPALLMNDPDFADFNLHRFGYPTSIVGQISDIRHQGEFLASFLTEELPTYRSTVLVGHSIGGLVILHALLSLEGQDANIFSDRDVKVLSFGTPFSGAQTATVLRVLNNAQTRDVETLNEDLMRLRQAWTQRFNRMAEPGGRITPHVPIYAYYGSQDDF